MATEEKRYSAHRFVDAQALGHRVTVDPNREAYVWGPDINGRMCHVASCIYYADALRKTEELNGRREG